MATPRSFSSSLCAAPLLLLAAACGREPFSPETRTPVPGSLVVVNTTTGASFDVDGFDMSVDGGAPAQLDLNASAFMQVEPGAHTVEVSGIAGNCMVDAPRRWIFIPEAATVNLWFTGSCTPQQTLATTRVVFARESMDGRSSLVAVNADGSERLLLTSGARDRSPAVSPDGRRIAFSADRDDRPTVGHPGLYVMNADGSGIHALPVGIAYDPSWSPDGRSILFTSPTVGEWGGTIHRIDADGGNLTPIATEYQEAISPVFSPDGSRIAFVLAHNEGTSFSVAVINSDGTGMVTLAWRVDVGLRVAWSPDGRRIAYSAHEGRSSPPGGFRSRIQVVNVDGSAEATLLETRLGVLEVGEWSSDGTLLFTRGRDVHLLRLEDGFQARLTAEAVGANTSTPVFLRARR